MVFRYSREVKEAMMSRYSKYVKEYMVFRYSRKVKECLGILGRWRSTVGRCKIT